MKIMTIVGTRPELIKLSRVIPLLDSHFDHTLVHTGQNYDFELNQIFFDDLDIRKPDYFLEVAGSTTAGTIANVIEKSDELFEKLKPDALVIYGDTNSCLCVISAKKKQIPIFHLEAGNRCFDQRVPEEINRKIVDHLSDINMVHSEHARRYLLDEGLNPELIIKTGSPMYEILSHHKGNIDNSDILSKLNLTQGEFFIVSTHREENVDYNDNFNDLLDSLNVIARKYNKRVIVSTHPRTRKKLEEVNIDFDDKIEFLRPLGFLDYNKLQQNAFCVLSDSGTLTEEASILKFPGIMIRQAHERPEGMDVGAVIMSGLKSERIIDSIELATSLSATELIDSYQNMSFSSQVIKIIQSYTDYINRVIWRKNV
jgi:UDP-N-acetylglucosamine 2-epimerase (non-hydrolysing)